VLRLVAEYRARYPAGRFLEEALGVGIEAAADLADPRAADLAGEYLRRFARGRFREAAERALSRFRR
jgi:hypothetical protein